MGSYHGAKAVLLVVTIYGLSTICCVRGADFVSPEVQVLLSIKESLVDPSRVLASWDAADSTPCNWTGVLCRGQNRPVVFSLILKHSNLSGTISPRIGELTYLETLHLGGNFLRGEIPSEIGRLSALTLLDLGRNFLSGSIPATIGNVSSLQDANFEENYLTGALPPDIGNLTSCRYFSVRQTKIGGLIPSGLRVIEELNLQDTKITGPIPGDFFKQNQVKYLYLNNLQFSGSMASEFGQLPKLEGLYMRNTGLLGAIPANWTNTWSLMYLDLSGNRLNGQIPESLGRLSNLKMLELSRNSLSGSLPQELGKFCQLEELDLSFNQLSGPVPDGLCAGGTLKTLNLADNGIEGSLPPILANCSTLVDVNLGYNAFSGTVSWALGSGESLLSLRVGHNLLNGSIPPEFGMLRNLTMLDLSHNNFSGSIPPEIQGLVGLQMLNLSSNQFSGSLPPNLSECKALDTLLLQRNGFTGEIPVASLSSLPLLAELNLAGNRLEGGVAEGLGNLSLLSRALNLSSNSLNGSIPSDLGKLEMLESLDLSFNEFSGEIPVALQDLHKLQSLDLSYNQLTGNIPPSILTLDHLKTLNLSYNRLTGVVPVVTVASGHPPWPADSFLGNVDLCVTNCSQASSSPADSKPDDDGLSSGALAGIVVGALGALGFLLLATITLCFTRKDSSVIPVQKQRFLLPEIYKGLTYNEIMAATDNLSDKNRIGRGGYGTVYKGTFANDTVCAVKQIVMAAESSRASFQTHLMDVEIAGQTDHKNIVKLMGFCHRGDETLIVYEFMPNGSLGDALHKRVSQAEDGEKLSWETRFKILCGAAAGIESVHNHCKPQVIHRDLKSNNILLDGDMEPCITDFGMTKMVENAGGFAPNMAVVAGSGGYLAPEYCLNMKMTDKSDVYSFGVIILEVLTGTYPEITDDFSLVDWVIDTLRNEGVLESILDTALREEVIESHQAEEQMTLVLQIGLLCTVEDPEQRPSMREVQEMLEYSKGEHGKIRVPDLNDLLHDLSGSPDDEYNMMQ